MISRSEVLQFLKENYIEIHLECESNMVKGKTTPDSYTPVKSTQWKVSYKAPKAGLWKVPEKRGADEFPPIVLRTSLTVHGERAYLTEPCEESFTPAHSIGEYGKPTWFSSIHLGKAFNDKGYEDESEIHYWLSDTVMSNGQDTDTAGLLAEGWCFDVFYNKRVLADLIVSRIQSFQTVESFKTYPVAFNNGANAILPEVVCTNTIAEMRNLLRRRHNRKLLSVMAGQGALANDRSEKPTPILWDFLKNTDYETGIQRHTLLSIIVTQANSSAPRHTSIRWSELKPHLATQGVMNYEI